MVVFMIITAEEKMKTRKNVAKYKDNIIIYSTRTFWTKVLNVRYWNVNLCYLENEQVNKHTN